MKIGARKFDCTWVIVTLCFFLGFSCLGFVLAANGLGGALAAQVVTPIIYQEGNPFGYRNAC